ncbi:SprB repeat-containing protein, partial [uncultured Marivirga sp.]|uniref:SprB repeat-containing protein n=1 Tax=uncultured Marivirga sp. TaxID=1123707 RepID=UPI0030EC3601
MNKLYTKIFGLSLVFFLFGAISNQSLNAQCPTAGAANKSHTDISCFGADDGTITVEMTDGTAPFQFDLYDNNTGTFVTLSVTENQLPDGRTVIYSDVPPSSYQVVVFKAGCTPVQVSDGFTGFLIEEPSLLSANVVSIINDCDGTGSGAIDIDVAGGIAPYSFAWSGPTAGIGDTDNPINLNAGAYDVVVTDDNGCTTNINGITVDVGPNAGVFTGTNGAACNDSA